MYKNYVGSIKLKNNNNIDVKVTVSFSGGSAVEGPGISVIKANSTGYVIFGSNDSTTCTLYFTPDLTSDKTRYADSESVITEVTRSSFSATTYSLSSGQPVTITLPSGDQMLVQNSGTASNPHLNFSANFDLVVVSGGCH